MSVAMWIVWLFWMGSHYIHSSGNQWSAVTGSFKWGSIIWLFWMGSHYRLLSANQWYAVNDSFKYGVHHLTVLNGLSLLTFISQSVICCKWQLQMGGDIYQLTKEGLSTKFELILGLTLASQRSFLQKTN